MRHLLGVLFAASLLLFAHPAHACGDKLLILGRPLRFNSRPATILAYAPPGSAVELVLNRSQWTAAMTKGKHRLREVETVEQLAQAVRAERFDVILVASADAPALRAQLANASFQAVFLPVVASSMRDAFRNAEKEYSVAMKGIAKSSDYLSAIDRAVALHDLRVEATSRTKKNSGKNS